MLTRCRKLTRETFRRREELDLVELLRRDGRVATSLVALQSGAVVGHILFTALPLEIDGVPVRAASLAPTAIRPDLQRLGIGSRLVADGLRLLRKSAWSAVIAHGNSNFYARFGFSAELARKLSPPLSKYSVMARELVPGALAGNRGLVRYPAAFNFA